MGIRNTLARLAALVTAVALVLSALTVSQSPATASGEFVDDDGSPHEWAIEAIAGSNITDGCGPAQFCPEDPVTREQMATFFVRAFELNEWRPSGFGDISVSPHALDIEKLAVAGITIGCAEDAFCPTELVTRSQMATLLARALELDPIEWRNTFRDDDGMIDEPNIEALANERVTLGCASQRYCPSAPVKRGEMASLLARSLKLSPPDNSAAGSGGGSPTSTAASVTPTTAAPVTTTTAAPVTTTTAAPVTTTTAAPVTTTTAAPVTTTTAAPVTTTTAAPVTTTTAAPVTTTTAAPVTTTTAAPSGGFPDASNTGVPAGTALKSSGSITINTPGTVIDGYDVSGTIYVRANNVTIRNTKVRAANWWVIKVEEGLRGVVIEDCELDGGGTAGQPGSRGVSGPADVRRCEVVGVENGLVPWGNVEPVVLEGNYVHGLAAPGAPHYDGIEIGIGSDITVRGNTVINGFDQTAAFGIWNDFGRVTNVLVENNRFIGGGYSVYVRGDNGSWPVSGITIRNNRLGKGKWGYASIVSASVSWTGNVDDTSGKTVN